jgi:hypothetical protein
VEISGNERTRERGGILKTRFHVSLLSKLKDLPLFGYLFPADQAGKRGKGRFSKKQIFSVKDS